MGQMVKAFYIQRAGDDCLYALVGDFPGSGGGYAKQEFFYGGIFYVFEKFLHGFRYGDTRSVGEIVATAKVGGDGSGGDVQDTFLIRREFQGHFADCGMTVMSKPSFPA